MNAVTSLPPPPLTAPLAPLRPSSNATSTTSNNPPPATAVTLTAPRPETERTPNEYVDTPFRNNLHIGPPTTNHHGESGTTNHHHHHHHNHQQNNNVQPPPPPSRTPTRPTRLPLPPVVTKQPPSSTTSTTTSFSKESNAECATATTRPSIVCPDCGRCRCDSCQQPRPLPQRWICNDGCLLSADTVVDYVSCLCCAKALFYHCSESDGGESCADEPCGCSPQRRKARWGCLGALSCLLPCLWFYWPLRGCKSMVEVCYARHSRTGCRCKTTNGSSSSSSAVLLVPTPEKRLLDSPQDY